VGKLNTINNIKMRENIFLMSLLAIVVVLFVAVYYTSQDDIDVEPYETSSDGLQSSKQYIANEDSAEFLPLPQMQHEHR
jgi:hypothetical protein